MNRYRKKPVVIEAWRINSEDYDEMCDIVLWCGGRAIDFKNHVMEIDTLEGTMYADPGDWIIKGTQGEFYPCKHQPFLDTFELVEDQ